MAFVNAFVVVRDGLDNEEPLAGVHLMEHLEPLVGDVNELSHCNQAHVTVTYPGNLENTTKTISGGRMPWTSIYCLAKS